MEGILRIQMDQLGERLSGQNISFELTGRCIKYLINEGFDIHYGARPLKRLIQKKILDRLSIAMLDGSVQPGMHLKVDAIDGEIQFHEEKRELFEET
jgi:ATP-dependent Clp protease ATP-binding subunit ClpA